MSDEPKTKVSKGTLNLILAVIGGLVAAISLTYAITTGNYSTQLADVTTRVSSDEGRISVLETTVAAIRAEFGTKLDNITKQLDLNTELLRKHMLGEK
jgi:hypothetical protein